MDVALPPMNPEVARLRRKAAQRKFVRRLRYVRFLWGIAGVLLLLLTIEVLLVLTISPRFWIYRIKVEGGDTLTKPEIITLASVPEHSNFYRLSLRRVAQRIMAQEPRAGRVTVHRSVLGVLHILVEERQPICRLGQETPPRYLDIDGILFTRPSPPSQTVPVVEGLAGRFPKADFGKRITSTETKAVIACLTAVNRRFGADSPLQIGRITVDVNDRMVLHLLQGTRILLGAPEGFDEKMYTIQNTILYASTKNGDSLDQIEYINASAVNRAAGLAAEYKPRRNREGATP